MAVDADLYLRTTAAGALTADEAETTHIVDLGPGGTGINGMEAWILVPSATTTGDTLACTLYFDDTAALTSPNESATFPILTEGTDTFPALKLIRFHTNRRYVGLKLDVTDVAGGSVSFGVVQAGIKLGSALRGGARP